MEPAYACASRFKIVCNHFFKKIYEVFHFFERFFSTFSKSYSRFLRRHVLLELVSHVVPCVIVLGLGFFVVGTDLHEENNTFQFETDDLDRILREGERADCFNRAVASKEVGVSDNLKQLIEHNSRILSHDMHGKA